MIVSHEHKFIFLKTIKTAGTSIEAALAQICGPDDIITPYREASEKDRKGRGPQNFRFQHPLVPKAPLWRRGGGGPGRRRNATRRGKEPQPGKGACGCRLPCSGKGIFPPAARMTTPSFN